MFERLNRGLWEKCYSLIDPKLKDHSRVELPIYSSTLQAFMKAFGTIKFWRIRVNLHLNAPPNKQDKRPFAYVYVGWQDHAHGFHMFKER